MSPRLHLFSFRPFPINSRSLSSCTCAFPTIPSTHPIDTTSSLANTAPNYHTHLLLHTGRGDWPSKIDQESLPYGPIITALRAQLKSLPSENKVLLGLSSFPTLSSPSTSGPNISGKVRALLLPNHQLLSSSSAITSQDDIEKFAAELTTAATLPRSESQTKSSSSRKRRATILLCSHGGRDVRCGLLGPWLAERVRELLRQDSELAGKFHVVQEVEKQSLQETSDTIPVTVGLVSHVGGHKWAGNMIFYFDYEDEEMKERRIRGAWYGRVNEENVGLVLRKSLLGFVHDEQQEMIVEEACRGVVY